MTAHPRPLLFVASRPDIAGGEVYLQDVLRHLDRALYVPVVAVPREGAFSRRLAELGVETIVVGVDYGWLRPPLPWYQFLHGFKERVDRLAAFIRERGVALVHTNSNQAFEGAVAARAAGVPHVHVVHIPFQTNLPIFERLGIDAGAFAQLVGALSSRVVAVAEPVAQSLSPPLARDRIRLIHNGIDLEAYRGARARADGRIRREFGFAADSPLVCGVGRLHPDKGFESFIDAAAAVLARVPQARFVIAGAADSDAFKAALEQRIGDAGVGAGRIVLAGFRDDVPDFLAEADVFLLTSRAEGGPYVLLEAMASECACVATRCGGFVEHVVDPGRTGFLVDVGDAAAAAAHVTRLLEDAALRRRVAAAGCDRVHAGGFDVRQSVSRLMAVYAEALAEPRPAAGGVGVTMALQAAREIGALGAEVTDLKERMKRVERAADLVLDNPLVSMARRVRQRGKPAAD